MPGFSLGLGLGGVTVRKSSGGSAGAINLIPASNGLDASPWTPGSGIDFISWTDPWGDAGNGAQFAIASSSPVANAVITSDQFVLGAGPVYCLSLHALRSVAGMTGTAMLRISNVTKSTYFQIAWTYVGDVATYANSTNADSYGITTDDFDAGWYRLHATLDTTADSWDGDTVEVILRPYGSDTTIQHGIGSFGIQIDNGPTPGEYLERP